MAYCSCLCSTHCVAYGRARKTLPVMCTSRPAAPLPVRSNTKKRSHILEREQTQAKLRLYQVGTDPRGWVWRSSIPVPTLL